MANAKNLIVLACLGALSSASAVKDPAPFPEGYRKWSHVHSALVAPGGGRPGLYHIYANEAAMRGYATGHFPNGSVIAFDLFDYKVENNVTSPHESRRAAPLTPLGAAYAARRLRRTTAPYAAPAHVKRTASRVVTNTSRSATAAVQV